jgi:filamentous hemagglutinin
LTRALPRSFELTTETGRVWVHGNATEHLAEYALARAVTGSPEAVNLATQVQLSSLQSAVGAAGRMGIKYGELMKVGHWELVFAPPRAEGQLPALIHALHK